MSTTAQPGDSNLRDRALILLAAVVIVLPLMMRGVSCGHDVDFHVTSWLEAAEQWRHGILWPRWAFTPAYGAGEPRFLFYPPLSWFFGGLLALVLPVRALPAAFTLLALTACGLTMRRFAAEWTSSRCALFAAVFYMANPYMLFSVYERCAYGELLAAAWMPMLLLAALRRDITLRDIAVPVALLWLTNAPSAVLCCYLFAVLALLRLGLLAHNAYAGRHVRAIFPFLLRAVGGVLLGLGLAAFYIVPAARERAWVQMWLAIKPPMDVPNNTLFHPTWDPAHDAVLRSASWLAVILIVVCAAMLFGAWKQHSHTHRRLLGLLTTASVLIAFALTPPSLFLWRHLPQLHFVQFPWRLLSIFGVILSLLLALALQGRAFTASGKALIAAAILLPMAFVPPVYRQYHQLCFDGDLPADQLTAFRSGAGTDPTEEYTPVHADNKALQRDVDPWWVTNDPQSLQQHADGQWTPPNLSVAQSLLIPPLADQSTSAPLRYVVLHLRNYPAWQVRVNDRPAAIIPRRDGLIAVAVPAEETTVSIRYRTLPDEIIGDVITLIALIIFLLLRRRAYHRGMNALTIPIKPPSPFLPAALPT